MSSLASFLVSRRFFKNLLLAIVLSVVLAWVGLWLTNLYSHHGEKITVPDLKGKQLDEVATIIDDANLKYEVLDSIFNREAKPGSVIDQFPRSGKEVKRKRVIALTIAALAPQKVKIGAVKDLSLRQAIGQLSKQGIYVKNLQYVESSFTNLVLGMTLNGKPLKTGDVVYKGDEVTLRVGKGDNALFSVPNLIGLSANYAKRKTLEAGLNIGKITFKDNSEEAKRTARVLSQSVNSGANIEAGSRINIILDKPKETENE